MRTDLERLLSQEENAALRTGLLALLADQARAYALYDSASMPAETAAELLTSLLYTLGVLPGLSFAPLAGQDLRVLYTAGLRRLEEKTRRAQAVIRALCLRTPDYGSLALHSTMSSILAALDHYDTRFFAHRIPGEIDYQLALPVAQDSLGIDYILDYLAHLGAELRFLSCFRMHRVLSLLDGASPDWREAVSSLYEPIAANALGLSLLGMDPRRLHVRSGERRALLAQLGPMQPLELEHRLIQAGEGLLDALGQRAPQDGETMRALCRGLAPRIVSAAEAGDLSGVFAGFGMPVRSGDAR